MTFFSFLSTTQQNCRQQRIGIVWERQCVSLAFWRDDSMWANSGGERNVAQNYSTTVEEKSGKFLRRNEGTRYYGVGGREAQVKQIRIKNVKMNIMCVRFRKLVILFTTSVKPTWQIEILDAQVYAWILATAASLTTKEGEGGCEWKIRNRSSEI